MPIRSARRIVSSRRPMMAPQYRSRARRRLISFAALSGDASAARRQATANVGAAERRDPKGSSPRRAASLLSQAIDRASASGTASTGPKPRSTLRPLTTMR